MSCSARSSSSSRQSCFFSRFAPWRCDGHSRRDSRVRLFCQIFTLVPLAVFVIFSITHRVKLNWTGPLWLAVIPAIAAHLTAAPSDSHAARLDDNGRVGLRRSIPAFLIYLAFGLPGLRLLGANGIVARRLVGDGCRARATQARRHVSSTQTPTVVVGMDRNFIASRSRLLMRWIRRRQSAKQPALISLEQNEQPHVRILDAARESAGCDVCCWSVSEPQDLDFERDPQTLPPRGPDHRAPPHPRRQTYPFLLSPAWLPATG